jgi:AcrR family transcriptional regulator
LTGVSNLVILEIETYRSVGKNYIMSKSKQRILNTASNLFSEFGFLGVSMEDIAKHLNITKAGLYYHFKSKKDLYLQVLERAFENLITKTFNNQSQEFSQLIRNYIHFSLKEKNLIQAITLKSSDIDPAIIDYIVKLRKQINKKFQIYLKKIFKKRESGGYNLQFVSSSILGIMDRLIIEASLFKKRLNVKKETSQILKLIKPILKVEL